VITEYKVPSLYILREDPRTLVETSDEVEPILYATRASQVSDKEPAARKRPKSEGDVHRTYVNNLVVLFEFPRKSL